MLKVKNADTNTDVYIQNGYVVCRLAIVEYGYVYVDLNTDIWDYQIEQYNILFGYIDLY